VSSVGEGIDRAGTHPPLVTRELFDKVPAVLDAQASPGAGELEARSLPERTLVCAECGSRLYYVVAKGCFGYFRCIGRNTGRTRRSTEPEPLRSREE